MIALALLAALTQTAPAPQAEPPLSRAEICQAHMTVMIEDEMTQTGRVAGPSWFIQNWWEAKLTEAEQDEARRKQVVERLRSRDANAPDFRAERLGCVTEAFEAGAVP